MKNGGIILVAFLFATSFFGKNIVATAFPDFAATWKIKQNVGAVTFEKAVF